MKSMKKDWYKKVWTMDIQNMSWVEDSKKEVDFLIDQLKLQGKKSKILLYGQLDYPYGEPLRKPEMKEGNPIRLYTISEISKIFSMLGMSVCKSYADYTGKPSSDHDIQLMVYSVRS